MLLRPRRFGTPVILGVAVATLATLAVTAQGFPVSHVSLNDGGIWVTDNSVGAIGRFAKPVAELDGQIVPSSQAPKVDVWQDGTMVAAYDQVGGKIYSVDAQVPAFADNGTPVPPNPDIALGGSTLAVLSTTEHALRTATLQSGGASLAALTASAPPLATGLPPNAAVTVGADGTVFVAGGGELRTFVPGGTGKPAVTRLPLSASDPMQVTAVGDVPVVADQATGKLYLPDSGHAVPLPEWAGLKLQQPSGSSDVVVAATAAALYSVDLNTGQLSPLSSGHSGSVAAPVQVGDCVHAAWYAGGTGSYVYTCGSPPPATRAAQAFTVADPAASLVFRVNNGQVVLNDTANGTVFLIDSTVATIRPKWAPSSITAVGHSKTQGIPQHTPLTANPYTQGVRPGRTTVVHVLDVDKGTPGVTYEVTAVTTPDNPSVKVAVAPDGQTVLATVGTLTNDAHFQYTIDDGHNHQASATVTLVPRSPGQNGRPVLKPNYHPPALATASGGTLTVPVIGNWRDPDGDPLYIDSGSVNVSTPDASASVTSGGAISFTAPQATSKQTITIRYGVSDGIAASPTMTTLKVTVAAASSTSFTAPVAEPDAAQGVVGSPLTLRPLANDLPGVDPTNRAARLTLAASVADVANATVSTDQADGIVTFTATRPGDYFLTYTDAYGSAPTQNGTIRVHVVQASGTAQPPVTTPDVAVLHGQQAAVLDVLADDYDPQGWLLGVTGAVASTAGVQVAVVDQRWLRITADNPVPGNLGTVTYTVSDGRSSATGTVAVTAASASQDTDQITTTEDSVTVRSGDSAAAPVLDDDGSSTGLPLSLAGTPPTVTPSSAGLLASVQGENVRVTAPAGVTAEEEVTVSYTATDASGATASGLLDVTIMPPPDKVHPDLAPVPQEVDARETAGDIAVISIPVDGVDPDGDSVTVTQVTVPPTLGRIVAIGPNSVSYQSYPGSSGTDAFTYEVTDPYGLTATAQVRIAVLPPSLPQPPVAVDDIINAPPGATLHWNVLANDYVTTGDDVTVEPLAATNKTAPAGVRLAGDYAYLQVPAAPSAPPVQFSYGDTDGSAPSLAQVVVHAVRGAQVPPIANDDIASAPAPGARAVTVDVLRNDDDPLSSSARLRITGKPAGVTVTGGSLVIPLTAQPREVPYQITAPDGLTATAVVYVPGTGSSAIRLKKSARVTVGVNGSITEQLSSLLLDTAGRPLKITTTSLLAASPAASVTVSAGQATAFTVHALGGYAGPGDVTVQVYDGATLQDPGGHVATVSIPVQVGPDAPILRCPAQPVAVAAGGAAQSFDIGQLCHVWVDTTVTATAPRYTVTWVKPPAGVNASVPGGTRLSLVAGGGAVPGSQGVLQITPAGAVTGAKLDVTVTGTPLPVGRPVSVTARPGASVTVDLHPYVTSLLARPDITVLRVSPSPEATVAVHGSSVTITPTRSATGTISLTATVTDEAGSASRAITLAIAVILTGQAPGKPGTPSAKAAGGAIDVSWTPAPADGSPVQTYTVYANGVAHQCPASPCTISPVSSGTKYTIWVTATNGFGTGPRSDTVTVTPDGTPGQVSGLATAVASSKITLSWAPVTGSTVSGYQVETSPAVPGLPPIVNAGKVTSRVFTGLADGTTYTFRVRAANGALTGPWSTPVSAVPFGKPSAMAAPVAAGAAVPNPGNTRAITVSWTPPQDNGSALTGYTVTELQAAGQGGPWSTTATAKVSGSTTSTSFTVPSGTQWYEYSVTASNAAGTSTPSPQSTPPIQAVAPPGALTGLTASDHPAGSAAGYDNAVHVSFTVPAASAKQISAIEYGIDAARETGTLPGPFPAGANIAAITSAMTGQIANGTPVTIYIAACASSGLCSAWTGPSNQVNPYGPPPKPNAAATANGNQITFTWSGNGGNGRALTGYSVCIDGACTNQAAAGTKTVTYGYNQTHTLSVTATDTAGQQSSAATAQATTTAAPAGPAGITVTRGTSIYEGESCKTCYAAHLAVANFPANSVVTYKCTSPEAGFWQGTAGTPYTTNTAGVTVQTDANGSASFDSYYVWSYWGTGGDSITCTSNGVSDTFNSTTQGTLTVSSGSIYLGYHASSVDTWVHITVANFPPDASVSYSCTTAGSFYEGAAGTAYPTDAAGGTVQTGANGSASFDSQYVESGGGSVTCTSDGVSGTGTVSPDAVPPGAALSVTEGAVDPTCANELDYSGDTNCIWIHLTVSGFTPDSIVDYGCTDIGDAGAATAETNSGGGTVTTDASGSASFDTTFADPGTDFTAGSLPYCTSDNVSATYAG